MLNETHDPSLLSWVDTANWADTDFPLQNLPFGVFRRAGSVEPFRGGVAIGDQIVDLGALGASEVFDASTQDPRLTTALSLVARPQLNDFMAAGGAIWSALRLALSRALRRDARSQPDPARKAVEACLIPQHLAEYALPAAIGDFTDFYTSIHHATAVGRLFRPDNPLLPNYKWVPIGYHGRSSSILISGQNFHRPNGQRLAPPARTPTLGPSQQLDFELEVGVFVGPGNVAGVPIGLCDAEQHVFGICLLNDWSARDLQAWEYQPLGPFLGKNFATSISPWIVTLEALAPFRTALHRPVQDPTPLPYLAHTSKDAQVAIDMVLEVALQTESMRRGQQLPQVLSRTNFRHSYWSVAQLVTHHTVNGCNLRPGDLFGSGTQSGPGENEAGSMLELSRGGQQAVALPNAESRTFIEDGDRVLMRGHCSRDGARRIGFGSVEACVLRSN